MDDRSWQSRWRLVWQVLRIEAVDKRTATTTASTSGPAKAQAALPSFDAVLPAIQAATVLLDRDGRVIAFNEAARTVAPALQA
ncbi:MAG TPA: hypothetical protein VFE77_14630, partial [Rhodanobacter sp.]|nr:hypothetical protein [Rhodanobacter sp.]